MRFILTLVLCLAALPLAAAEGESTVKEDARAVGSKVKEGVKDGVTAVGQGARDAATAVGHASRDAVHAVRDAATGTWEGLTGPDGEKIDAKK